jgi:hypothetical protein
MRVEKQREFPFFHVGEGQNNPDALDTKIL